MVGLGDKIELWNNNKISITFKEHKIMNVVKGNKYISLFTKKNNKNALIFLNNKNYLIEQSYEFEMDLIESMAFKDDENLLIVFKNIEVYCLSLK